MTRRRRVLEVEHVIGWNFSSTWFQRRAGLTTLVATTAGGSQSVPVLDVPEDEAVRLAREALPDLVDQFLVDFGELPARSLAGPSLTLWSFGSWIGSRHRALRRRRLPAGRTGVVPVPRLRQSRREPPRSAAIAAALLPEATSR